MRLCLQIWRMLRCTGSQDDTLRLLDTTLELPILGYIIGDESSFVSPAGLPATEAKLQCMFMHADQIVTLRPMLCTS